MDSLESELQGSGHNLGCRGMGRRLLSRYSINIPRHIILEGQRMLDPLGVELRRRHRLRRRSYVNKGPNYAIHVDQHDKLKVYGFAVHGAIDGFSRRLLWLKVAYTNNDPRVVASYFLDFLRELEGVPRCIQMDRGTENVLIEDIQVAFHSEYNDANDYCVIKSTSPHNQRIERFWMTLFAMMENYWVDTFRLLVDGGTLDCTSPLHVECLRFCFNQMIQCELDDVRIEWNQHRTRASPNVALPGKPDIMYFLPVLYDTHDYRIPVPLEDIIAVKEEFTTPPPRKGCSSTDMEDHSEWCK
ncbi:uncharacterized protein LOC119740708 [Patiria miniata]|uniref:Integrase core domain-containing protein n=1 Tax=Patiria miniata TaxID=46514 RepID=A0A914B867_PATMI|nr:uncharacterized protein LOC119740708 [Patiria miniata]